MPLLLAFSATLLIAVLLSARFSRTLLFAAVLFLAVGAATGYVAPQLLECLDRSLVRGAARWFEPSSGRPKFS